MGAYKFGYELGGLTGASQNDFDGDGGFQNGGFNKTNQFAGSTPTVLITMDMSTPSTAGINLTFASGSLNMDWKEGGGKVPFVSGVELTHTYITPGTYIGELSGSLDQITQFIADNSKITGFTDFKTGLLTNLRLENNLLAGNLSLLNAAVSEIIVLDNNTGLTGVDYALSGNAQLFIYQANNCGLVGVQDFSNLPVSGSFQSHTNPLLTGYTYSTTGNAIITNYKVHNCNLTGVQNFTNVPLGNIFESNDNPLLTGWTFSTTGNTKFTSFLGYDCNVTGNQSFANNPVGEVFWIQNNPLLTNLGFSTTGNTVITSGLFHDCNLTGNQSFANVPLGTQIQGFNNPLLTSLTLSATNNGALTDWRWYSCTLTNMDMSVFPTSNNVNIQLENNAMSSTEVDNQMINIDATGWTGGTLILNGTNAARTSASDAANTNLLANSWSIFVN